MKLSPKKIILGILIALRARRCLLPGATHRWFVRARAESPRLKAQGVSASHSIGSTP